MEFVQATSIQPSLKSAQATDLLSPTQPAIARYTAKLHATINKHRDSVLQLLKLSAMIKPLPDLSTCCDKLRGTSFPIISGLATLITHLGGEKISVQELEILTHQAKDDALELHATSMSPKMPSHPPVITTRQDPILPPGQIKSSLKGKIPSSHCKHTTPPPNQINKCRSKRQGR